MMANARFCQTVMFIQMLFSYAQPTKTGEFVELAYFTSEADARQGESRELPPDAAAGFQEWERVMKVEHYRDLTDPWLTSGPTAS